MLLTNLVTAAVVAVICQIAHGHMLERIAALEQRWRDEDEAREKRKRENERKKK